MVVIAIIAILAAVAIPMYSNYTTRAKLGSQLTKLGGAKTNANDYITNNAGNTDYISSDIPNLPFGAAVNDGVTNGRIDLDTSSIVSGSELRLTPLVSSGTITWTCNINGVNSTQAPANCSVV
ncbi:type IV pili fiber building block protein [Francisella halioticida]|uniref:pilin n=1 Tax=Francisella halioticida TaxID=549298 RepID=UPI001AF4730D|nr:type IV pili fiber building block protein [Francisella halioticida]